MVWNFNMSAAPRGTTRTEKRMIGKTEKDVEVHVPELIFAADEDGKTVTISKWLPKEGRWNMFSKDRPPIAWMPWPVHPHIEAEREFEAETWAAIAEAETHQARMARREHAE